MAETETSFLDDPDIPPELRELAVQALASSCTDEVIDPEEAEPLINRHVVSFFEVYLAGNVAYLASLTDSEAEEDTEGVDVFGPDD